MSMMQIARNSLSANNARVMGRKILRRLERNTGVEATTWAKDRAESLEAHLISWDPVLWEETLSFVTDSAKDAKEKLASIDIDLGGGGAYPLLFFLVRLIKPEVVVETGVAAGWSPHTILEALSRNERGRLFSSDFPYFRLSQPERFIGVLVPEHLRSRWSLDIRGDQIALPCIVNQNAAIDLFHYDSDKSYAGRRAAYKLIEPRLTNSSWVIMDDIHDNLFFRDWVTHHGLSYTIFEFEGKFVGLARWSE